MSETKNIFQRMSQVTAEIGRIPKNLTVGFGKNQYKAVAEADVLNAVKAAEQKAGVFSYPREHKILTAERLPGESGAGAKVFVRVESVYRFVNLDKPDEYIEVNAYGDGVDTLDKAPGKATTYADKYALMKGYKIETGDDTDNTASDNLEGHDIWAIKKRIETKITDKMKAGVEMGSILGTVGLSQTQFEKVMGYFQTISTLEAKLR